MTSFYMFRLIFLTFFGGPRMTHEAEHHVHESPKSMTVPLIVLAICSIFAGYLGVSPSIARCRSTARPIASSISLRRSLPRRRRGEKRHRRSSDCRRREEEEHDGPASEYLLMVLSVGAAGCGWWHGAGGPTASCRDGVREPIARLLRRVYRTLLNKYYVDEFYDKAFTGRTKSAGAARSASAREKALGGSTPSVIDGGVNGAGWLTRARGMLSSWWDKWIIDGFCVNGPAVVARMLSKPVRLVQWACCSGTRWSWSSALARIALVLRARGRADPR